MPVAAVAAVAMLVIVFLEAGAANRGEAHVVDHVLQPFPSTPLHRHVTHIAAARNASVVQGRILAWGVAMDFPVRVSQIVLWIIVCIHDMQSTKNIQRRV